MGTGNLGWLDENALVRLLDVGVADLSSTYAAHANNVNLIENPAAMLFP